MEGSVLSKVVLPLALFIVMLGMGLSLVPGDFRRVLKQPKGVLVGVACQLLLLPVIGFVVVKVFGLTGALAVGLMILTFSPGGTTSNMISFLSRGDVALSISLTAVVSLVTPFTIPLLTNWALGEFMGEAKNLSMPVGKTIAVLIAITILPVAIGMFVKRRKPDFALKAEKPVRIISVVVLFLIIAAITLKEKDNLAGFFAQTGWPNLVLNVVTMGLGFAVAKLARLRRKEQITVAIEVGIQNGTTALFVTQTLLDNSTMSIAPAIYSLIMFATGAAFGVLVNMGQEREEVDAEPALVPPGGGASSDESGSASGKDDPAS